MKIGIIHGFVGGGGETEKLLINILDTFSFTKHQVTLYTISKPMIEINSNIKVETLFKIKLPIFGLIQKGLEQILVNAANKEDILISSSGGPIVPRKPNQKIIIYCQDDFNFGIKNKDTKYTGIWKVYSSFYSRITQKFIKQIMDPRIILVSNSKFTQNLIKKNHGKDSELIYPGIEFKRFPHTKKEKFVISVVNRISSEKNIELGIASLRFSDIHYYIISNIKTRINKHHVKRLNNIFHTGPGHVRILVLKNLDNDGKNRMLNESKVYLSLGPETFGIDVIEGIAAGCIPIVPNNTANKETVPFADLRFNNEKEIKIKVKDAMNGKYDYLLDALKGNNEKFTTESFKRNLIYFFDEVKAPEPLNKKLDILDQKWKK